jgi:hypothetical protein
MPDINFTDFYEITEVVQEDYGASGFNNLSPDEFGISGGNNFDLEPEQLSCREIISQWCATQGDCIAGGDGLPVPDAIQRKVFEESYPNCLLNQENQNETILNEMEQNPTFDIKSPSFLGGPNVHSLIIIVLGVLILASVTRGNIIKGIGTAVKDTVK